MIVSKKQATFGIMLERPGLVRLMEPRGKSRAKCACHGWVKNAIICQNLTKG